MAGNGKKWLLGCGLGCGLPMLLVIVLLVGGSVVMMKPFKQAVDTQQELKAALGDRADYVPAADSLSPERLDKFIRVRGVLVPLCDNFTEISRKFSRMDELEADGEEPSKREIFGAVGEVMGAVFGIAGNIGRFTQVRNEALLAEKMSFGEYIWIYTLVYNSWLGYSPNTDFASNAEGDSPTGGDEGAYDAADQKLIRQLMRNHAGALAAAGRASEAAAWEAEADHLERQDGSGVPWHDTTLPAPVAAALEPYRNKLVPLFCAASASFEFDKVHKKGLRITAG